MQMHFFASVLASVFLFLQRISCSLNLHPAPPPCHHVHRTPPPPPHPLAGTAARAAGA